MSMSAPAYETFECKDCGRPWVLMKQERRYFEERGLFIPVRCKECRAYRKQEAAAWRASGESR